MASRRSKPSSSVPEDELKDLIMKLRSLLPTEINRNNTTRVSLWRLLEETCNHIKRLQSEVDGLSERLYELMASPNTSTAEADILRRVFEQQ
ncbi:hypothetical protein AAG906_019835 [Vitis piasezkii]